MPVDPHRPLSGLLVNIDVDDLEKATRFADPFGNGFCLLQFTGRGYDEIAK